jgi:SAM-dependent methyltransferase
MSSAVLWQDVEYGAYTGDLDAWERLAEAYEGPVLELGCGSGRVALHLGRRGHRVWGLDSDPELVAQTQARAESEGLEVHATRGDATELELDREFGLVLAPMQLVQVLGGPAMRAATLRGVAAHLRQGGAFAAAIIEAPSLEPGTPALLPDVKEVDGWVYSSLPVSVAQDHGRLEIRRVRQIVSPGGEITEDRHTESLDLIDPGEVEREAEAAGLSLAERIAIPSTDGYIGATAVVAERQ